MLQTPTFSRLLSAPWYGCRNGFRYLVPFVKLLTFSRSKNLSKVHIKLFLLHQVPPSMARL